jgi:hypothetical protein
MHRITWFVGGFIAGIAALLVVQQNHIVRADEGFHLVPRVSAGYDDIYVDIREFGFDDWNDHQGLSMALVKSEKEDLLKDAAVNSVHDSINAFFSRRE